MEKLIKSSLARLMKFAPHYIFIRIVMVATSGCGELGINTTVLPQATEASSSVSADPALCARGRAYRIAPASNLVWTAIKNQTIAVNGTHNLTGSLQFSDLSLAKPEKLTLAFGEEAMETGVEMRNERIRRLIFGVNEGFKMSMQIVSTNLEANAKFPEVGASTKFIMTIDVSVAGQKTQLDIPVELTASSSGFSVKPVSSVKINIRDQILLGSRLDSLMKLASVVIADTIEINFSLELLNDCGA